MRGTWQSHEIASSRQDGIRNDNLRHVNTFMSFTTVLDFKLQIQNLIITLVF
jgi:hypothetical protein